DIPVEEAAYAFPHGRLGAKTDIARKRFHIGQRLRNVAGLHRQEVLDGFSTQRLLDMSDINHHVHRLVITYVVDAPWRGTRCRVGLPWVERRVRLRRMVKYADHRIGDVVYIREVALHATVI